MDAPPPNFENDLTPVKRRRSRKKAAPNSPTESRPRPPHLEMPPPCPDVLEESVSPTPAKRPRPSRDRPSAAGLASLQHGIGGPSVIPHRPPPLARLNPPASRAPASPGPSFEPFSPPAWRDLSMSPVPDDAAPFRDPLPGSVSADAPDGREWDDVDEHWDAVWSSLERDGLERLNKTTFVLANWDIINEALDYESFYHLNIIPERDGTVSVICECPNFSNTFQPYSITSGTAAPSPHFPKTSAACAHHCFVMRNLDDILGIPLRCTGTDARIPGLVVFRNRSETPAMVVSAPAKSSGKREFVHFFEPSGAVRCRGKSCKRGEEMCFHAARAIEARTAYKAEYGEEVDVQERDECSVAERARRAGTRNKRRNERIDARRTTCISNDPVPTLPSILRTIGPRRDTMTYPEALLDLPALFPLDRTTARCSCGAQLNGDTSAEIVVRDIPLFGSDLAQTISIEMVKCSPCKGRRWMASDQGKYKVFLWSGESAFTHDLLHDYTRQFSKSETPFHAFCESQVDRYKDLGKSRLPFCSQPTFQSAWLVFSNLVRLDSFMECPVCGANPEVLICDGTSGCIPAKHVTDELRPENYTDEHSPHSALPLEKEVFNNPQTCLISDKPIQKYLREWLAYGVHRSSALAMPPSYTWEFAYPLVVQADLVDDEVEKEKFIPVLALLSVYLRPDLPAALLQPLHRFLRQICAPDMTLAICPKSSWELLREFKLDGHFNPQLRFDCPGLYDVMTTASAYPDFLSSTCDVPYWRDSTIDQRPTPSSQAQTAPSSHLDPVQPPAARPPPGTQPSPIVPEVAPSPPSHIVHDVAPTSPSPIIPSPHPSPSAVSHRGPTSSLPLDPSAAVDADPNEYAQYGVLDIFRHAAGWMADRSEATLGILCKGRTLEDSAPRFDLPQLDFRLTGSIYGKPQIRQRKVYDGLPDDQGKRRKLAAGAAGLSAEETMEVEVYCNKYYAAYTNSKQTGGLFALWCVHSVCYGCHMIPKGEGRDDLFSALYTRFEVAPKIVIYDFACAAAAYCWRREPFFFQNTRFLIDELHRHNHTTCSHAFFANEAMESDPEMRKKVKTSAAEHGNGSLKKIRKSLSYMTQWPAIVTTWVYIHLYNRKKQIPLDKAMAGLTVET